MSDERHSDDSTRARQGKSGTTSCDGIPREGTFTAEQWAGFYEKQRKTAVEWFKEFSVPVRVFGREIVVEAEDFWKQIDKTVLE